MSLLVKICGLRNVRDVEAAVAAVEPLKCRACGECVEICPQAVWTVGNDKKAVLNDVAFHPTGPWLIAAGGGDSGGY